MLFFESTPTGRLLNRFTNDTDVMDYVLVTKSLQAMASIGWFLTSFFVIAVVLPLMTVRAPHAPSTCDRPLRLTSSQAPGR